MIFSFPIGTEILLWALGESHLPDVQTLWVHKLWSLNPPGRLGQVLLPLWTHRDGAGEGESVGWLLWARKALSQEWERRVASICLNRQILDTWRVWHRLCSSDYCPLWPFVQCPPFWLLELLSVLFRALCCVLTFAFFESCREGITHCFPTWKMPIMKLNAVGSTFTRSWMASQACYKPVGSLCCPKRVCFLKKIDFPSQSTWKQSFSALTILQVLVQNLMNVLMCNARMLLGNLWELNEEMLSIEASGRASKFSFAVLLMIIII